MPCVFPVLFRCAISHLARQHPLLFSVEDDAKHLRSFAERLTPQLEPQAVGLIGLGSLIMTFLRTFEKYQPKLRMPLGWLENYSPIHILRKHEKYLEPDHGPQHRFFLQEHSALESVLNAHFDDEEKYLMLLSGLAQNNLLVENVDNNAKQHRILALFVACLNDEEFEAPMTSRTGEWALTGDELLFRESAGGKHVALTLRFTEKILSRIFDRLVLEDMPRVDFHPEDDQYLTE